MIYNWNPAMIDSLTEVQRINLFPLPDSQYIDLDSSKMNIRKIQSIKDETMNTDPLTQDMLAQIWSTARALLPPPPRTTAQPLFGLTFCRALAPLGTDCRERDLPGEVEGVQLPVHVAHISVDNSRVRASKRIPGA